jgi:SSS family solute:Na+ symporter
MTQLLIICGYLGLLLLLGIGASRLFRGTSQDYMLASHSIGPFLLLMSIFGTTMTAFALVGSTGESFKEGVGVYGMLASSSGIIHSLCFFLLGVKVWKLGKAYGYRTQVQFFRDRLESRWIGLVLFPVLVGLVIPYLLIGVMASGTVINKVTAGRIAEGKVVGGTFAEGTFPAFLERGPNPKAPDQPPSFLYGSQGGVPKPLASLAICGIVLIYVFMGGMRGTAWANTFQTIVFMVLGLITFVVIAWKLGGQESFWASLQAASAAIPREKLTRLHIPPEKFLTYMFVPLSVGMFPHLFQHWLTARSANSFKLPVVAHPLFIAIVWVPCVLIGAWATSDLITIPPPVAANPNAVLPFLVQKLAGPVLGGFLTAGILAAIMSSLDSQFLCLGTMFTEDVVQPLRGSRRLSDRHELLVARGFIIAIVAVTYGLSLLEPRRVFTLGVWCFSGFSSLFPLILAALYWPRLTKAGAYACVLAAAGSWLWLFTASDFAGRPNFTVTIPVPTAIDADGAWQLMPVAAMIAASTAAVIIVSLLTKPPSRPTLRRFFPSRAD